ncbi:MAG: TetR/AcrR family transcriptional regulator [Vallitalea sp.]|jgi:AcrR family transcriptional regulator|nr:TetR/AcrR family transcriptional regulator [Vallitalea sp.]
MIDRRSQRTRTLIFEAFNELLREKRYSKITVQDIILKANIGRSTFYSHFETKDELLNETCKIIFAHVFSDDIIAEAYHNFTNEKNITAYISHILYHLKEDDKKIKSLFIYEDSGIFISRFKEYFKDYLLKIISIESIKGISKSYLIDHITCSFVDTIIWWLNNCKEETPETIAKNYLYVIRPLIKED